MTIFARWRTDDIPAPDIAGERCDRCPAPGRHVIVKTITNRDGSRVRMWQGQLALCDQHFDLHNWAATHNGWRLR